MSSTPPPSSSSSGPNSATLNSVTFSDGWIISKDEGGTYDAPQWKDSPARNYPYLYATVSGKNILTVSAKWTLGSSASSAPYVKGTGPGGINIPSTQTTVDSGGSGKKITLPATAATTAFPNQTNFYNPFTIQWEISFDGGTTWQNAGESQNPIYVCISDTGPNNVSDKLFRTEVHLACSVTGATTSSQAMQNTWSIFSNSTPTSPNAGPNGVKTWDGRTLYYYQPGTDFSQNPGNSLSAFFIAGTGRCGMWSLLLYDSWVINGVSCNKIGAFPYGQDPNHETINYFFYVDNWGLTNPANPLPGHYTSANPYTVTFPNEMQLLPNPPGGQPSNYGDITSLSGHAGQNSPTPSQKIWGDHEFLQYTDNSLYYDPSYGVIYTSELDFQTKSLMCFGNNPVPIVGNYVQYDIWQTSALNVFFYPL
jgi:hypothetical protein